MSKEEAIWPACNTRQEGESEEEILRKAAAHAKGIHGMEQVPPGAVQKIRESIRPVP